MSRSKTRYVGDLPSIDTRDIKKIAGGHKRFNKLNDIVVHIGGIPHLVHLLKRPANISSFPQRYLGCEECNGPARKLRVYQDRLYCSACLEKMNFRYRSQKLYTFLEVRYG